MNRTDWDNVDENIGIWEGMKSCRTGDTLGMLLNLDGGTLTVYKNNHRLGVMQDGVSGSNCCHVYVAVDVSAIDGENDAVEIQSCTQLPL